MNRKRLTKSIVEKLEPTEKDYFTWCGKLSGFGVRVWPNGKKTFIVQYRTGGRGSPTRRKSLGAYGLVTAEEARRSAEGYLASAQLGNDLVADERKAQSEMTVSQLCDEYVEHGMHLKKASTIATDIGRINGHIRPLLGMKKIGAVSRQDIERFLNDVAKGKTASDKRTGKRGRSIIKGGKGTATRTVRLLGGIFTYAVNQGYLESNPRAGVKVFKDNSNEVFLSQEQIERLAATLDEAEKYGLPWQVETVSKTQHMQSQLNKRRQKISPHVIAAIQLLLFTGCRLREILHLRWDEVDFERGLLNLPDTKTGRKTVLLSNAAIHVLRELPRVGQYVIAGNNPDRPRSDLKRPWERITRHAKLEGVRLHDLRHTFASIGAAQGMSLAMIGALLGHKSTETTARYAHLTEDPLRAGLNKIAGSLVSKNQEM